MSALSTMRHCATRLELAADALLPSDAIAYRNAAKELREAHAAVAELTETAGTIAQNQNASAARDWMRFDDALAAVRGSEV